MKKGNSLSIEDYLEASSEASKRTRVIMVSIVVASVLTFAGFLNSLEQNWMLQRVQASALPNSPYVKRKFPNISDPEIMKKDQEVFYSALVNSYVNNTYTIRVPFFGITFDVNDLGLIGGISFIVLLLLFRFSLVRELDNLILSFEEAKQVKELPAFYNLLAMRQVLTVPPTKGRESVGVLMFAPKILSFLPLIVLSIVIGHDFMTYDVGAAINVVHTVLLYIFTAALWAFVMIVSISSLLVWLKIDAAWRRYWNEVLTINTLVAIPPRADQTHAS
jgi:hypothetical protein